MFTTMEISMKESFLMIRNMAMESCKCYQVISTKENGVEEGKMEKESTGLQTKISMKDTLAMA